MSLLRQAPTIGVQLQSSFPIANYALDTSLQAQSFAMLSQTAQTGFDMVKREFDKDAIEQAQRDAPALIQRDGQGLTMPVSTFEPPGITSRAYRDAYMTFGKNAYTVSVEQDHQNFLATVKAKHPTDIDAATKAMNDRRDAVVAGLDPELAPLISLKLNAMNGQVTSQINATAQAESNKVAEEKGLFAYRSVLDQASRLATTPDKIDIETMTLANSQLANDRKTADELLTAAGYTPERRAQLWQRAGTEIRILRDEQMIKDWTARRDQFEPGEFSKWLLDTRREILDQSKKMGPDGDLYFRRMTAALSYATQTGQLQIQQHEQKQLDKDQQLNLGLAALPQMEGMTKEDLARAHEQHRNSIFGDPNRTTSQKVRALGMLDQSTGRMKSDAADYAANAVTQLVSSATSVEPGMTSERRAGYVQELKQFVSDPFTVANLPLGVRNYAQRAISQIATDTAKTDVAQTLAASAQGFIHPNEFDAWTKKNPNYFGDGAVMNPMQLRQAVQANTAAWAKRTRDMSTAERLVADAAAGVVPSAEAQKVIADTPSLAFTNGGRVYDATNADDRVNVAAHLQKTMTLPDQVKSDFKNMQFGGDPAVTAGKIAQYGALKTVLQNKPGFDEERAIGFLQKELGDVTVDFIALAGRHGPEAAANAVLNRTNAATRNQGQSPNAAATDMHGEVDKAFKSMADLEDWTSRLNPFSERTHDWERRMLGDKAPSMFDQVANRTNRGPFAEVVVADDLKQELAAGAYTLMNRGGQLTDKAHPNLSSHQIAVRRYAEGMRDEMELVADPANPQRGVWQWKSAQTQVSQMLRGAPVTPKMVNGFALGLVKAEENFLDSIGADARIWDSYDRSKVTMIPWRSSDGSFQWKIQAPLQNSVGVATLMTLRKDDPRLSAFAGDIMVQAQKDLETHWYQKGTVPTPSDFSKGGIAGLTVGHIFTGIDNAGKGLFADYKRQQYLEKRLEQMRNPEATDRDAFGLAVGKIFGQSRESLDNHQSPIATPETIRAMQDSRDEDFRRRVQGLEYFRQLNNRVSQ